MLRRIFRVMLLTTIMSGAISFLHTPQASAVTGGCYFASGAGAVGSGGTCSVPGYGDYGTNDVLPGRSSSGGGKAIPDYVNTKQEFINFVKNKFNNGNTHEKVGAAFIIQSIRGDNGWPTAGDVDNFEKRINQPDVTIGRANVNINRTSWYDAGKQNTFYAAYSPGVREVIQLKYKGNVRDTIETGCANLANASLDIPPPIEWGLNSNSKVNKSVLGPGQTATFDHKIKNTGPDKANYDWQVTGQLNGNGFGPSKTDGNPSPLPSRNGVNPNSGEFAPDYDGAAKNNFTFPNNAVDGDKYCERIEYTNANGPNTATDNSQSECVTYNENWTLDPESTGGGTVTPGQTVTFDHKVTNLGPNTATYSWQVEGEASYGAAGMDNSHGGGGANASPLPRDTTAKNTAVDAARPNYGGNARYTFVFPANAPNGAKYCQRITATDGNGPGKPAKSSAKVCATLSVVGGPVTTQSVHLGATVTKSTDEMEPTESATFSGSVNVTHFPVYTEWGYSEVSKQIPATRVSASSTSSLETDGPYSQAATATTTSNTTYSCPHAQDSRSGSSCRHDRNGASNDTKAKCLANGNSWDGSCYSTHPADATTTTNTTYSCPNNTWVRSGSTCSKVRYRCKPSTTWGAWNASQPSCPPYWTCPNGAAGGNVYQYWAPTCQGWTCSYSPQQFNQPNAPTCEYRCNNGTGNRAYNSDGQSAQKCYIQPSFTVTCSWDSGQTASQTVTGNGTYCTNQITKQGITIGVSVCATMSAGYPNGWSGNPPPGWGLRANGTYGPIETWGWDFNPQTDSECVRVVGRPTAKISGGDIIAGGAFKTGANFCDLTNTGAAIVGWPHTPAYNASGTQFAAFASGSITGFATGMIRANSATPPRSLAFANTPTSLGDRYGGSLGWIPCASDHYGLRPAGLPTLNANAIGAASASGSYDSSSSTINSNVTIAKGKRITLYATGNVYIRSSGIRYERGWINTQEIPAFKLVVSGGNIYIDPGVSQLDGVYVAQPDAAGIGGEISTCATAFGSVATTSRYDSCRTQLTVNGVFIAKKVSLLRTEGTAIFGQTAEQFNYLPELWLTSWPADNTANEVKYDSIISLPPVL